ncbi:MAG TPA: GNAT family N-acetyltransferase, partial [Ornithinibacter sp.]|nr:GNAT family N-acetyltransferase [Ornithinibacter sp.]
MAEAAVIADELVLRAIQPQDVDQTAELLAERGEPADAEDLRLVLADPSAGPDGTAVVVDGDRVVATASLLDEHLELGGFGIPAGQVELVATAASHEGRGLARALMDWCHDRSAARGHLAQVMIGIPNFYRQFGYGYAIPMHP